MTATMTMTAPDRFDVVFAALSDPTRRSIVRRLADGEATVLEMGNGGHARCGRSLWSRSPHGPSTPELNGSTVSTGSMRTSGAHLTEPHP